MPYNEWELFEKTEDIEPGDTIIVAWDDPVKDETTVKVLVYEKLKGNDIVLKDCRKKRHKFKTFDLSCHTRSSPYFKWYILQKSSIDLDLRKEVYSIR